MFSDCRVSDDPDWKFPAEIDLVSVDYYCAFHKCRGNFSPCPTGLNGPGSGPIYDLSFDKNCTPMLREIYQRFIYPRLGAKMRTLVVPGAQASNGHSAPCRAYGKSCDNPLNASVGAYDSYWARQAKELWAWAAEDPRLVGFAPYHFQTEPSYGPAMAVGFRDMPKTLSAWAEIGLDIVRAIPGATTLRARLDFAVGLSSDDGEAKPVVHIDLAGSDTHPETDGTHTRPFRTVLGWQARGGSTDSVSGIKFGKGTHDLVASAGLQLKTAGKEGAPFVVSGAGPGATQLSAAVKAPAFTQQQHEFGARQWVATMPVNTTYFRQLFVRPSSTGNFSRRKTARSDIMFYDHTNPHDIQHSIVFKPGQVKAQYHNQADVLGECRNENSPARFPCELVSVFSARVC